MALITAEEFKRQRGISTGSKPSPSTGLISAEEFKKQRQQQEEARKQIISNVPMDHFQRAKQAQEPFRQQPTSDSVLMDSFQRAKQMQDQANIEPRDVTPSPSKPIKHEDIISGRVQLQDTGERLVPQMDLQPIPKTVEDQMRERAAARSSMLSDNPLVRSIQAPIFEAAEGLDRFFYTNPVGQFASRVGQAGARMFGVQPEVEVSTGSKVADTVADVVGTVGSIFVNPGGVTSPVAGQASIVGQVYNNPATQRVAQAAASRVSSPTGQRIVQEAVREGITGAVEGGAMALARGADEREALTDAALGGAIGGVVGGALPLISDGVRNIVRKYRQEETLALPVPRREQRLAQAELRRRQEYGSDPIVNEYTFSLPDESPETRGRLANIEEARNDLREIENEIRVLQSRYEKAINDQYEYLKSSMENRRGVRQGQLLRNQEGEVIGRVGRTSENPEWYQKFYRLHGRAPSRRDLYNLAKEHVDEGFMDSGVRVPSWKEQHGYDEALRTLEDVRNTIRSSLREIDPSIQLTDARMVDQTVARRSGMASETTSRTERATTPRKVDEPIVGADRTVVEFESIMEEVNHPRIRDKVYDYFDEAERKARERIASRRNRLSANPLDEWKDYAVIMASKVIKGSIRLADFTEELVKEFGEEIRPYANRILRRTMQEIKTQTGKAAKEIEEVARFNAGGGDANTFRAKINRNPKRERRSFSEVLERARTHFVDDLAALESLEKRVLGTLASAEDSLYKTARLFKGAPSKAHQIVQDRLSPIARQVEQAGYTMDDLGDYALAVHARDVNAKYMKSGFTDAEIRAVIERYENTPLEQARQQLMQISNDLLNELADAQVIRRELVDTLRERWPNYMPLFRSFDDDVVRFESGLSKTLANVTAPIERLKGSERKVLDPIENMVKNIFRTVNTAERNRVALQLARLADNPNAEGVIRRLGKNEEVGRKNVVSVLENGERVRYEVEPNVYKALLNLDQESSNMLINILSKPASVLRAGATLTPEFSLRNPMRDIVQAFVVSKSGFNPLIDFPIGLIETIKGKRGNSQLYSQWVNDLGDFGNIFSMDRKVHREALNKVIKQPAGKNFVNILNGRALLGVLRKIADTTESATKLGEYRAALRSGASRQEAAYRSRDIMDFARAGSSIRQANKIIAFFNANIQGKSKILRAAKENPVGVLTRAFTAVTVPTVAVFVAQKYLANDVQRNTIDEAPDWMKDTFWLLPIPGTDVVARIPKPFDLAPLFSNLPERSLEYVYNEDREAFDGFVRRSMGDLGMPVQISGLWPFMEGIANYSFFRDAPLIPRREQNLEFRDQYDPVRTSETARLLARGAEFLTGGEGMFRNFSSPRVMENTIRGLTAGLGSYATDAIDAILRGTGLTDRPQAPEKRLEQKPLVRAFTVDPMQSSKTLDKFYGMKEDLDRARASARINERPFDKESQYQTLNRASSTISDINKMIRNIESSDLSADEKRDRIEQLQKQRLDIARQALQIIEGTR